MQMFLIRTIVAAMVIGVVAEVASRSARWGALLLAFPAISVAAFWMTWLRNPDLQNMQRFSRETLVLVPLGLLVFVPLAFAERLGIGFEAAMTIGIAFGLVGFATWIAFGPSML